jgi:hypothetical protein
MVIIIIVIIIIVNIPSSFPISMLLALSSCELKTTRFPGVRLPLPCIEAVGLDGK